MDEGYERACWIRHLNICQSERHNRSVEHPPIRASAGPTTLLRSPLGNATLSPMSKLAEIEAAVDGLPVPQQEELFRHLAERLRAPQKPRRRLPLVPPTGRPITQEDIDDALDAD